MLDNFSHIEILYCAINGWIYWGCSGLYILNILKVSTEWTLASKGNIMLPYKKSAINSKKIYSHRRLNIHPILDNILFFLLKLDLTADHHEAHFAKPRVNPISFEKLFIKLIPRIILFDNTTECFVFKWTYTEYLLAQAHTTAWLII